MSNKLVNIKTADDYIQSMVDGTMENIYNKMQKGNNLQNGGTLFSKNDSFENVIKTTKNTETAVINELKNILNASRKYMEAYGKHLDNLKKLDKYVNFNGMTKMFTDVILKNYLSAGFVDKRLELLFNNYSINTEISDIEFIRSHILQQVLFVINKYFSDKGGMSNIKYYFITVGTTNFTIHITNKSDKTESHTISHRDYIINIKETVDKLQSIIVVDKNKLKQKKPVLNFDDDDKHNISINPILVVLTDPVKLAQYVPDDDTPSKERTTLKRISDAQINILAQKNKPVSARKSNFKMYATLSKQKSKPATDMNKSKTISIKKMVFPPKTQLQNQGQGQGQNQGQQRAPLAVPVPIPPVKQAEPIKQVPTFTMNDL